MQSIQTLNPSLYQDSSCYSMFNTKLTPPQIVVCDNSIPIWAHNIVVDVFRHSLMTPQDVANVPGSVVSTKKQSMYF